MAAVLPPPASPTDPLGSAPGPLWSAFRRSLLLHRVSPAILWGEVVWTYDDLASAVLARVTELRERGVGRGDRVLLLLSNGPGYWVADLALMAIGSVKVPVSPMLSVTEIGVIAERVRPACVVLTPELTGLVDECGDLARLVTDHAPVAPAPDVHQRLAEFDGAAPGEPAAIYFSGGTTGEPKGIVHSQQGLVANLWSHVIEAGIGAEDTLLLTTPQAHAAGLFGLVGLLRGACVRIENGFDVAAFRERVDADATTWTFAVPTMINRLVAHAEEHSWRPASLRTVQYGAAPISAAVLRRALDRFGPVFQQLYAQTECPNYATVLSKADHVAALSRESLLGSAGRPALMCEVTVLDDEGAPVPVDAVGEVCLRAPYVMTGYWEDEVGYAARFHGSWLRTGDVGRVDADGYLFLVDRRNDMIVSGGMNVHSIEVEAAIQTVPGVLAAAVIGVPHSDWGEAVHAVVVAAPDGTDDGLEQRVMVESRAVLATYKRPKSVEVVAELPLTRYGKIDKKALRARYWGDRARGIN